jgi:DNA-binding XRE family transcriptional regulator
MDLREARFKRRLTQWSLSKIANVHQSRISLIENGDRASEKEQSALSKGLGMKVEDIDWPNN